jgi:hypothetical protein
VAEPRQPPQLRLRHQGKEARRLHTRMGRGALAVQLEPVPGTPLTAIVVYLKSKLLTFPAPPGEPVSPPGTEAHRSLQHRATPATVYTSRPKASPGDRSDDTRDRVRGDRVDTSGKITLRHQGRLYSIGIGRTHTRVIILVQDRHIRVVDAATGKLIPRARSRRRQALPADSSTQHIPLKSRTAEPTGLEFGPSAIS